MLYVVSYKASLLKGTCSLFSLATTLNTKETGYLPRLSATRDTTDISYNTSLKVLYCVIKFPNIILSKSMTNVFRLAVLVIAENQSCWHGVSFLLKKCF